MGLFEWFARRAPKADARLITWRKAWASAVASEDAAMTGGLRAQLDALGLPDEDVEIEREMLDGLQRLAELRESVRVEGLPGIETGHRVVGAERCHFSAPASMPDEPAQPSGRLLLTSGRAIFLGGSAGTTVAWYAVSRALHADRDILLVRADRDRLYRFRCNSFADAMGGAFLARHLLGARRPSA
jgi:hypothetical protein